MAEGGGLHVLPDSSAGCCSTQNVQRNAMFSALRRWSLPGCSVIPRCAGNSCLGKGWN